MRGQTASRAVVVLFVGIACCSVPQVNWANSQIAGRELAVLIGIERYQRANPLRHTVNDVRQLAETLSTRGHYARDGILEITDAASNEKFQPNRANIETQLPAWLKSAGPDDTILIFFSGHGFRDDQGKMYLAPIDCDAKNPAATGIPVQWFREQIAACRARFKLLVLDSCHAGSEKGEDDATVAARDLGEPFRDLEGVVTIASSTADEKSQIWGEKQQSLFSYWLVQGLKGHADENSDGNVDIDELYKYVFRNVTRPAKARFPRPQTPVRIVRSGTPDVPVVVRLQPQSLRQLLSDTAEQLSLAIEERKLEKLGVLEFTNDTKLGELLGADFGLLGRYCAEEFERQLVANATGRFSVVDRRRLQSALKSSAFKLDDLGSANALETLSERAGGMPVIALGTLRNRAGRIVTVQCKLLETSSDEVVGSAGGTAQLNESEWAMLGRSVAILPNDREPELPLPDQPLRPMADVVVARMDERSEGAHPMKDPAFPYRVRFMVDGKERQCVFKGNNLIVPVKQGEVYQLWIENRTAQPVVMRLLIDGLNTLPEKEDTKGISTYVVGKRVNLDQARSWVLDPSDPRVVRIQGNPTWAVHGFVTATGTQGQGKLREFKIVDASQSLAARQEFTDQIGLITAAFYAPASGGRGVGTDLGAERTEDLREREGVEVGNLLALLHFQYVEASAMEGAGR